MSRRNVSSRSGFPAASLLRLRRVLLLEVVLIERGVRRAIRFERPNGLIGAFGFDLVGALVEFRVDPYSGDIFEIEHDPMEWPVDAENLLPL